MKKTIIVILLAILGNCTVYALKPTIKLHITDGEAFLMDTTLMNCLTASAIKRSWTMHITGIEEFLQDTAFKNPYKNLPPIKAIYLSSDSAVALYGELGENGAYIETRLDISDPTQHENIYGVESAKSLTSYYHMFHRWGWLFYIIVYLSILSPFIFLFLPQRKSRTNVQIYESAIIAPLIIRVLERIVDILIIVFLTRWLKNIIVAQHFMATDVICTCMGFRWDWTFNWIIYIAFFFYYFCCEYFFGRTLGKWMCRMRVVSEDNCRPSARAIAIRTFMRCLSLDLISGFIHIFRHGKSDVRLLHDRWSKTKVISTKKHTFEDK